MVSETQGHAASAALAAGLAWQALRLAGTVRDSDAQDSCDDGIVANAASCAASAPAAWVNSSGSGSGSGAAQSAEAHCHLRSLQTTCALHDMHELCIMLSLQGGHLLLKMCEQVGCKQ